MTSSTVLPRNLQNRVTLSHMIKNGLVFVVFSFVVMSSVRIDKYFLMTEVVRP